MNCANTGNYIAVRFKGANYMCVEGSDRARLLREANALWSMGYESHCRDAFERALAAPGCAFEHYEQQTR